MLVSLTLIHIIYAMQHGNLDGFNCLFYQDLKKICLASKEHGELRSQQFYKENEHNKIIFCRIPRKLNTDYKFVINYLTKFFQSYLDNVKSNKNFHSYCIRDYSHDKKIARNLSIIQVLRTIYLSMVKNKKYIKDIELTKNLKIEHTEHIFMNAKDFFISFLNENTNIIILENFLDSEEQIALLYTYVQNVLEDNIFTNDYAFIIFLMDFKSKKDSVIWSPKNQKIDYNYRSKQNITYQFSSFSYTIRNADEPNFKVKKNENFISAIQIHKINEKAICYPSNQSLKHYIEHILKKELFIRYDIACFDMKIHHITYTAKSLEKLNLVEFRNQITIKTLLKSYDITIVTLVKTYKNIAQHIPNVHYIAYVSIYTNRINKKKIAYRFVYSFEKIKKEYHKNDSLNNQYKIQLDIDNHATYNTIQRGLTKFLEKQKTFDDFERLDLKYFIAKYTYAPIRLETFHFSRIHINSSLHDDFMFFVNNLYSPKFTNLHAKTYQVTFSINLYLKNRSFTSLQFSNLMYILNENDYSSTTMEIFYECKSILVDIHFDFQNEKKYFALIFPVQEQNIIRSLFFDRDDQKITSIFNDNLSHAKRYLNEHFSYLKAVFTHIFFKEAIFETAKFIHTGIDRVLYHKHFIDYVMCKFLAEDNYFNLLICCKFSDINKSEWFNAIKLFNYFKYCTIFDKILKIMNKDKVYNMLKRYIIKRIDASFQLYSKMFKEKNEVNEYYFLVRDKNILRNAKLHYVTVDNIR